MKQNRQTRKNTGALIKPGIAGTEPQKVKEEIQKDVSEGIGAMTSREAGAMND